MEDIKLNNPIKKVQYYISLYLSLSLFWVVWLLSIYGKNTKDNTKIEKNVLNKTWQKFAFVYGSILMVILTILIIVSYIL